jgi:hypothetical protein
VFLIGLADGSTVSGVQTISANASDNVGVIGVQFKLDGNDLRLEVTRLPYSTSWNTALTPNGAHVLTAVARDAAGNLATSPAINLTVFTPIDSDSHNQQTPPVGTRLLVDSQRGMTAFFHNDVEIIDRSGMRVVAWPKDTQWDGRDNNGALCASGIYYYREKGQARWGIMTVVH